MDDGSHSIDLPAELALAALRVLNDRIDADRDMDFKTKSATVTEVLVMALAVHLKATIQDDKLALATMAAGEMLRVLTFRLGDIDDDAPR